MKTSTVNGAFGLSYEISSDGRTVWVNDYTGCRARFGPKGYELHGRVTSRGPGRPRPDFLWRAFKTQCRNEFGIELVEFDGHTPDGCQKEE